MFLDPFASTLTYSENRQVFRSNYLNVIRANDATDQSLDIISRKVFCESGKYIKGVHNHEEKPFKYMKFSYDLSKQ